MLLLIFQLLIHLIQSCLHGTNTTRRGEGCYEEATNDIGSREENAPEDEDIEDKELQKLSPRKNTKLNSGNCRFVSDELKATLVEARVR